MINFHKRVVNRELGTFSASEANKLRPWFESVTVIQKSTIPNPSGSEIVLSESKENFLVFLTTNGQGFLYNFLHPNSLTFLNRPNEFILRLYLLENHLLIFPKENSTNFIKIFLINHKSDDFTRYQILKDVTIEANDLNKHVDVDTYNSKIIFYKNRLASVYSLPSCDLIFKKEASCFYYSNSSIVSIQLQDGSATITLNRISKGKSQEFLVSPFKRPTIFDYFHGYFVFDNMNKLRSYNFKENKLSNISDLPMKYFIGKQNSVAKYQDHILVMDQKWTRFEVLAKHVCADLVGVVIVLDELNKIIVFDVERGSVKIVVANVAIDFITVNVDSYQLAAVSNENLYIYE